MTNSDTDMQQSNATEPDSAAGTAAVAGAGAGEPVGALLEAAAAHAVPVIRGIGDDRLTGPTPCAEYDVRQLVNHLTQVVNEFQHLAVKADAHFTGDIPDRVAEPGWREAFAESAAALAAAWSRPGAEDGTAGQMNLPARTVGAMGLLDMTVHAWDLARATGQDYDRSGPSAAVVAVLHGFLDDMAPTAREYGVIGEPVPAPQDATDFERLLAGLGRDPHWTP